MHSDGTTPNLNHFVFSGANNSEVKLFYVGPTTRNHEIVRTKSGKIIAWEIDGQRYTAKSINEQLADNATLFGKLKDLLAKPMGEHVLRAAMQVSTADAPDLVGFLADQFRATPDEVSDRLVVLFPTKDLLSNAMKPAI
jgi:hypothetical protein